MTSHRFGSLLASLVLILLPWIGAAAAHDLTPVRFTNPFGTVITGYLLRPAAFAAAKKYPAVIALHGCGGLLRAKGMVHVGTNKAARAKAIALVLDILRKWLIRGGDPT